MSCSLYLVGQCFLSNECFHCHGTHCSCRLFYNPTLSQISHSKPSLRELLFSCCVFFQLLTHIFKTLPLFFQNFTHKSKNCTHKMENAHISCQMKHCIQNITNTSQKQTFVLCCKHLCHNIIFMDISYTQLF